MMSVAFLSSCGPIVNYLRHPTKYYLYSNKKLVSPDKKDKAEFEMEKKALHFRQGGHITYDYIKFSNQITFPNDSSIFKNLVKEILFLRIKDIKIDSIIIDHCTYIQAIEGNKDFVEANGIIYTNKSGKGYQRRFEAIYSTSLQLNIVIIGTYLHLKF